MERLSGGGSSAALGRFLLGSFALTVLSFLVSTSLSELVARGIEEDADSIATNASPSIYRLAQERSDLRLMEGLVVEYAHRVAAGREAGDVVQRIQQVRRAMTAVWEDEKGAPVNYPGERDLWVAIEASSATVDVAVARVLDARKLNEASVENALYFDLRPAVDAMSEALLVDIQLNARNAGVLAAQIADSRTRQRTWTVVLDGICAVFAVTAGVAVMRLLRSYTAMMDARLTELEHFAGRVAHDIRSPLTAVSLAVESTRRAQTIDEPRRAMLDRASRSIQRVAQVVDALLLLARAGMRPAAGVKTDVGAVAHDVIDELLPDATAKGIELVLEPVLPMTVACSPGVLTSLLSNLVGNAIKYIGDAPMKRVHVTAREVGPRPSVRIEVVDTGPGVPLEHRARIFDPYVRAAASSVPGLGLGLATVRRLVEAHDGAAGVMDGPEGGSCFWIELPKADDGIGDSGDRSGESDRR